MGLMRFLVAPANRLTAEAALRAYLVGPEQIPWVSRVQLQNGVLSLGRNESDSACLCCPFPVAERGEVSLVTGTLIERFAPYHLTVELARGKVNQLRSQIVEWQSLGLAPKEHHLAALHQAMEHLSRAVTSQHDPILAAEHAERAISRALDLSDRLVARYVKKVVATRHRAGTRLQAVLGGNLGPKLLRATVSRQFLTAFNAATVTMKWRDVEGQEGTYQWEIADRQIAWCHENGLPVIGGPLLQLDDRGLPDWLAIWQGDFDNILAFVSDYVETAVQRYVGKVSLWQCASRVNVGAVLGLSDEERLRLAVRTFEIVRKLDPKTPAILSFDQPWGEYMARAERDLSPLHFADILVRSGMDLSGIGLEVNVGYSPGGSYLRDSLECNRMIDRWAMLGTPLWLFITLPAGESADDKAFSRARPTGGPQPGGWSPEAQRQWLRQVVPLLLAKPIVRGVIYNQLCDAYPHEFVEGGLLDGEDQPKPAFGTLAKVRRKYLS
ncbi:MAG TPA: endo-1,4-beta-xylanase [Pirellulales bacterium]|nr:endo-1,4-beta-xylanase [Pirellulales bacterium]